MQPKINRFIMSKGGMGFPSVGEIQRMINVVNDAQAINGRAARGVKRGARSASRAAERVVKRAKKASKKAKKAKKGTDKVKMSISGQGAQLKGLHTKGKHKKPKASLSKRVKKLEGKVQENYWHHVCKSSSIVQPTCIADRCGYSSTMVIGSSEIEGFTDALPYYNRAAPGTIAQSNTTLNFNPIKLKFDFYAKITMRNNFLYPCDMDCYIVQPKIDSNTTPSADVTSGITTLANPAISSTTAVCFYPSDSVLFKEKWKIIGHCKGRLQSGDEMDMPFHEKFVYDHKLNDVAVGSYYKKYNRFLLIRVQGCVCHDSTTTTNVGTSPAALDCTIDRKFTFNYPSDVAGRSVEQTTGLTAIATAVVGVASAEIETAL